MGTSRTSLKKVSSIGRTVGLLLVQSDLSEHVRCLVMVSEPYIVRNKTHDLYIVPFKDEVPSNVRSRPLSHS